MYRCSNHPEREALSFCHNCQKDFCKECLDEGIEYYYCKSIECQQALKNEFSDKNYFEIIKCPNCQNQIDLTEEDNQKGKVECPECEMMIDFSEDEPAILEDENFLEILSLLNQGDIAIVKSILEDGEIDYFVVGEEFLSVRPLLEPVRVFVNEKQLEEARELLKDFDSKIFGVS